ncbi:MAG TPA: cellulose binding domain-containing protein [Streptosporangiaceae bacterium]
MSQTASIRHRLGARRRTRLVAFATALLTTLALAAGVRAHPASAAPAGFVTRSGAGFVLDGKPFRYGGTNNYYLHYTSQLMVDDVFNDAQAMGLTVLRAWTFLECGGDKPNAAGACSQGADHWMQRWSSASNGVVYNTGANGLQALDRMIADAAQHNIKLILPFTNNWKDFGGMDQYVTWYGLQFHDQFYTDARIKQDYKNWITTLLNRTNTVTGVKYKDDPTIFAWELANEPRCINASLPTSGNCTADTLTGWADEMSTFVKGIDPNHMVSVGDEGFHPGVGGNSSQWPYNITDGVDHSRLTALPNVDFGTYHLYPQGWGQSPADTWGTQWINDHNSVGTSLTKPEILEEFGSTDQSTRDATYTAWTNAVRTGGGDGWMFWLLTGIQDDGQLYPDFDGYRITAPSATATLLANAAAQMGGGGAVDTTPPTAPILLLTPTTTNTSVILSWSASTDNVGVTGYDVLRAPGASGGGFTQVGTSATTSFTNTGLTPATTYRYQVRARDAAGNISPVSNTLTVTTATGGGGTGACTATPTVQSQWSTGYVVQPYTVTNTGTSTMNGWTVTISLPAGHTLTGSWGATVTASGQTLTAKSLSWNGTLAPGASTTFGMQAARPSGNTELPSTLGCTSP